MPILFFLGDIIQMRKLHPCGSDQWQVLRTGMDFRLKCCKCGRVVMLPRKKVERGMKSFIQRGPGYTPTPGQDELSEPTPDKL